MWLSQVNDTTHPRQQFKGVYFINASIGWVGGGNGTILHTTNSVTTWTNQVSETTFYLLDVYFNDATLGWVVGDNGTILHTTNGGVTFVEEGQRHEVPTEFLLSQNYPNPFNPSTTIRYQLPKKNHITLKIYDIPGREVATLVNEQKSPGEYAVQWNSGNAAGGVYFYRLQVGDVVQTRGSRF